MKEKISYEPQASDFEKLFYEYKNCFELDTESDFTNYVDVIRSVGRKWVEMNLPDKIDLKYYYTLYSECIYMSIIFFSHHIIHFLFICRVSN